MKMTEDTKQQLAKTDIPMVTFTIDGKSVTVPKGTTVLAAAREAGIDIPSFCYHPKLKSVGSCRICYVEVEKMPKLAVSCSLEPMDGMVVHSNSEKVLQGRKAVLEFILANHPLDCPTCDKGGECELQDMTLAHGYDDSRFDFTKNRFRDEDMKMTFDDKKIGPEIMLNRNRCILCYKCVRANKTVFGEYDLGAFERGNITEINSAPGEQVDNPFSGNLVEICPVGALTSSDWRYQIRVWLTSTVSSIDNFYSSGSNTTLFKEDHKNRVYRTTSRPNDSIDDGWISDVTRYGYQITNSPDRLKTPLIKKEGKQVPATWDEALELICKRVKEIKDKMGSVCIGGLAAPNLDNAGLYSFSKFFRTVLRSNNIDFRNDYRMLPSGSNDCYGALVSQSFNIADIDESDVVVTFGTDLIREHPNEYLRIRKANNTESATIIAINPYRMKSSDCASIELVYKPGCEEAVINSICLAAVADGLVEGDMVEKLKAKLSPNTLAESAAMAGVEPESARKIARIIMGGSRITFFAGEIITRSRSRESIAAALCNLNSLFGIQSRGQITVLARYANSTGAVKLGLMPMPSDDIKAEMTAIWGEFPDSKPYSTGSMLAQMKKEEISGCFVMGANPMMVYPDREMVREGLERLDFLVACDLFETETTALADVVLPLAGSAEYDGDYVNLEGRVQRAYAGIKPIGQAKPAAEIVSLIAQKLGNDLFDSLDSMNSEIDRLLAVDGEISLPDEIVEVAFDPTALDENYPVFLYIADDPHHSGHLTGRSDSLIKFCDGAYIELSPEMAEECGVNEGESVRVESEYGKLIVPARISPYLDNNVVIIPRNFPTAPVTSLLMHKQRVDRVRISQVDD